jgi:hypothetical protein
MEWTANPARSVSSAATAIELNAGTGVGGGAEPCTKKGTTSIVALCEVPKKSMQENPRM